MLLSYLFPPSLSRSPLPLSPPLIKVMAICAHENMNLIAVGYKDGTVVILRGNITRDRQSRQRIVHKEDEPGIYVTGNQTFISLISLVIILFMYRSGISSN